MKTELANYLNAETAKLKEKQLSENLVVGQALEDLKELVNCNYALLHSLKLAEQGLIKLAALTGHESDKLNAEQARAVIKYVSNT